MRLPWRRKPDTFGDVLDREREWVKDSIDAIAEVDPDGARRLAHNVADRLRLRNRDTHYTDTPLDIIEMVSAALVAADKDAA